MHLSPRWSRLGPRTSLLSAPFALLPLLAACSSEPALEQGDLPRKGEPAETTAPSEPTDAGAGQTPEAGIGPDRDAASEGEAAPTAPTFAATRCSDSPLYAEVATTSMYDGQTHEVSDAPARCRAASERVMLFVAEELYPDPITQAQLDSFLTQFEQRGRAGGYDPNLGVLPTNEAVFGALGIEAMEGGKLPIFVIDTRRAGDGYLCGWCERTELHLDGRLLAPLDSEHALAIAAHESFHAIHRRYDADELVWMDETLAQAAMVANGYHTDRDWLAAFLEDPNVNWGPAAEPTSFHYGAGLAFGNYLWEYGGAELLRAVTQEPSDGWPGLDQALQDVGSNETGLSLFLRMALSLYLDDVHAGYGFASLDTSALTVNQLGAAASATGELEAFGLEYFELDPGSARVTLAAGPDVVGRVVTLGETVQVASLEPNAPFELSTEPAVVVLTATAASAFELVSEP